MPDTTPDAHVHLVRHPQHPSAVVASPAARCTPPTPPSPRKVADRSVIARCSSSVSTTRSPTTPTSPPVGVQANVQVYADMWHLTVTGTTPAPALQTLLHHLAEGDAWETAIGSPVDEKTVTPAT